MIEHIILVLATKINLVINGDAETGPCATDSDVTHPTGWNYKGRVTQISYTALLLGSEFSSTSVSK
jgi:hypothetical protein